MFSEISALTRFINQNPDLKHLVTRIQESDDDFWLVGGCLRNFILDLPQVDIDIACSGNPTTLAQIWATEVAGRWFWLDSERKQSRVLLKNGLTIDFTPLRAPSIIEDLQLRDFTINALALPLDSTFPDSELLDPLSGTNHLRKKQLHSCSSRSFPDDPLRMLKGIRHAVTLDFSIAVDTKEQICTTAHLLASVAGERVMDELGKILAAESAVSGIKLLIDTELIQVILGPPSRNWNKQTAIREISHLNEKIGEVELMTEESRLDSGRTELFSNRTIFLFAKLLENYSPVNLPDLLHKRLRLSRHVQHVLEELQGDPDIKLLASVALIEGQRRQALLVEKIEPFACEKMLYWGVCCDRLELKRVLQLQESFNKEQKLGRIPDLINGEFIASLLMDSPQIQIGEWQKKLKQAEINGEIRTFSDAESWLKSHLDP